MIFSVDVHFHDHEDILENEVAEIGQMMAFPIFDACLEAGDCKGIFGLTLRFINSVGDSFCILQTSLKLVVIGIVGVGRRFQ